GTILSTPAPASPATFTSTITCTGWSSRSARWDGTWAPRARQVRSQRAVRHERARSEPARGEPARGEPARGEPGRGEPGRGEPARGEPACRVRRPGRLLAAAAGGARRAPWHRQARRWPG